VRPKDTHEHAEFRNSERFGRRDFVTKSFESFASEFGVWFRFWLLHRPRPETARERYASPEPVFTAARALRTARRHRPRALRADRRGGGEHFGTRQGKAHSSCWASHTPTLLRSFYVERFCQPRDHGAV